MAGLCIQDYYVLYDKIVEMEKDGPIVVGPQGITINQFELMLSGFRVEVNQSIDQFYSVLFRVLTEIMTGNKNIEVDDVHVLTMDYELFSGGPRGPEILFDEKLQSDEEYNGEEMEEFSESDM